MSDPAVLSVDFELFEHTPAYRRAAGSTDAGGVGLAGGEFLRELLDRHDATATWFVVSDVAESAPDAVVAISDDGHEIGSHTHSHRLLSTFDRERRREEVTRSRSILESLTGQSVAGFRAPAFDVPEDLFALLDQAGYDYDASTVPCRRIPGWYGGNADLRRIAPVTAVDAAAPAGLWEVPTAVMPVLGLPLTGAWLRFFGPRYTVFGMRLLARRGIVPVLYVHPWEFVDLPDVRGVPRRVTVRTGEWMRRALDRILASGFDFEPCREAVDRAARAAGEEGRTDTPSSVNGAT